MRHRQRLSAISYLLPCLLPCLLLPQLARAATCEVDPSGSFGLPYASIDDAVQGGCGSPGATIEVYCPVGGCEHPDVSINGLEGITVLSAELWGFGPVEITGAKSGTGLAIFASKDIAFHGFARYSGPEYGIFIADSQKVAILGRGEVREAYSDVEAYFGIHVEGKSKVYLEHVGLRENTLAIELVEAGGAAPEVSAAGLAAIENAMVFYAEGSPGPRFTLRGDGDRAVSNYFMGNNEVARLAGEAFLEIDHGIFAGNMRGGPTNPELFAVHDDAGLTLRNALIYDNDTRPNPGVLLPCPFGATCINTAGRILEHASKGSVLIEASTIIDNECDLVFNLSAAGSGELIIDHTVMANNWGKVLSMSSWWPGCPPIKGFDAYFWDNRVDADPPACAVQAGFASWNPNPVPSTNTPDKLSDYPKIPKPFTDLYWIDPFEPSSAPMPAGLYVGLDWGVDGYVDKDDLDVGYHNPI